MLQNKNSLSMGWGLKAALGGADVDNAGPVPELRNVLVINSELFSTKITWLIIFFCLTKTFHEQFVNL